LRSLVTLLATLYICIACAGVDPRSLRPCDLTEGGAGEHALIRAGSGTRILLVDQRPVVVPFSQREALDCNVDLLRVFAGDHTLHAEFQIAGWSMYAAEEFALLAVPFEAKAGREYEIECGKTAFSNDIHCRIGGIVTDGRAGSVNPALYFDLFRAYAACRDEDAWVRLQSLRSSGGLRKSAEEWEPGLCKAFIDRR